MDLYAKNEKALRQLHEEIVKDIKTVLAEKGYTYGKAEHYDVFQIMSDRLLINNQHTDNIDVNNLLKHLHDAYHVRSKNI